MSSQPNAWGVYDMHGNLAEWTLDVYAPHSGREQWDSLQYVGSEPSLRTVKGGNFKAFVEEARSAARKADLLSTKKETIGFRILLGIPVIANAPIEAY
jgi:formylglycine-generating enzyme required for sulfatase activity